jgi:membrane-associated phospholipid phosphatase
LSTAARALQKFKWEHDGVGQTYGNMHGACDANAVKNLELTELFCGLAHLDFAFVPFDPSDYSRGSFAALFAFLPYFSGVFLIGYALASRSRHLAFVIAGLLVNEAANKVLKNAFKQPRPPGAALSNYGMPSSHSQFVAYLAACFFVLLKKTVVQRIVHPLFLLLVAVVAIMMWSRVYLGFHTWTQTVVGAGTGAAVAVSWIFIVHRFHAVQQCLVWCFDFALNILESCMR